MPAVGWDEMLGMVPFSSNPETLCARFIQAGAARLSDSFFDDSLSKVKHVAESITLTFDELRELVRERRPAPRGVVLHTGRCGSTVLMRMLARDRGTLAVSEPSSLGRLHLHCLQAGRGERGKGSSAGPTRLFRSFCSRARPTPRPQTDELAGCRLSASTRAPPRYALPFRAPPGIGRRGVAARVGPGLGGPPSR
jgi:hypothetical protein